MVLKSDIEKIGYLDILSKIGISKKDCMRYLISIHYNLQLQLTNFNQRMRNLKKKKHVM